MTGLTTKNKQTINGGTYDPNNIGYIDLGKIYNLKKYMVKWCHMAKEKLILQKILEESVQHHNTRVRLYRNLEKRLGIPVIAYYTNFNSTAILDHSDPDMLDEILQKCDLSKGVALMVHSPGGDMLAAERMINLLRSYTENKGYTTIVPRMAMSAATMLCLGSSKIIMSPSSSLGPIDPQAIEINSKTKERKRFSVFNLLKSYKIIFDESIKSKGNLEPYLQALEAYDPRIIEEYKSVMALSEDIAVKALKSGMLKDQDDEIIKSKIKIFLTPEKTKYHDRCIYGNEAQECELNIEIKSVKDPIWKDISELHLRLEHSLMTGSAKTIENKDYSFHQPMGYMGGGDENE